MMDEVGNNASPTPVEGESAPGAVNDAAVSSAEVSVPENAPLAGSAATCSCGSGRNAAATRSPSDPPG
jgi:hypothetical protein